MIRTSRSLAFALTLILSLSLSAWAQKAPLDVSWEAFRLEQTPAQKDVLVVLWLTPHNGWYTYAHEPGPTGKPTRVIARLTPSNTNILTSYPAGVLKKDTQNPGQSVAAYVEKTPLFIDIPAAKLAGQTLTATIDLLLCSDTSCYPIKTDILIPLATLKLDALPTTQGQPWEAIWRSAKKDEDSKADPVAQVLTEPKPAIISSLTPRFFQPGLEVTGLSKAALLAFLAGIILNFMPCVLPVLALKIRSAFPTLKDLAERRREFRVHNLAFAAGMLAFFAIFAGLAAFAGLAWGQLLQNPSALIVLTALVFAFGLSLLGVFHLPMIEIWRPKPGQSNTSGFVEPFFTGMLATLLATPCSGPFLGGVLAWALFQPPAVIVAVFMCIGLGMAFPYILAAIFPWMVTLIPKPGAWNLYLESFLGIFLLGTCLYLLSLLPQESIFPCLILLWCTGLSAVVIGQWMNLNQSWGKRLALHLVALLIFGLGLFWALKPVDQNSDQVWTAFDQKEFSTHLGQEPMLLEFTADWCPNCKFLEKTALSQKRIAALEKRFGFQAVRVDLSRDNAPGWPLLSQLGSRSIPLVALFPKGELASSPLILRDIFTSAQLERALNDAFPR